MKLFPSVQISELRAQLERDRKNSTNPPNNFIRTSMKRPVHLNFYSIIPDCWSAALHRCSLYMKWEPQFFLRFH